MWVSPRCFFPPFSVTDLQHSEAVRPWCRGVACAARRAKVRCGLLQVCYSAVCYTPSPQQGCGLRQLWPAACGACVRAWMHRLLICGVDRGCRVPPCPRRAGTADVQRSVQEAAAAATPAPGPLWKDLLQKGVRPEPKALGWAGGSQVLGNRLLHRRHHHLQESVNPCGSNLHPAVVHGVLPPRDEGPELSVQV